MWILIGALVFIILFMFGSMLYKTRVIQDYETRLPRLYQDIVDELNELKTYLDLKDRTSREPYMRGKINEMICKYSRSYRKLDNKSNEKFEELIRLGCEEYIKKN